LPSGELNLNATDALHFANGSVTDVSGRARSIDGVTVATAGGDLTAASAHGNVRIDAGALLDASAPAAGGRAGSVSLQATQGAVQIEGRLKAIAGSDGGGALAIDAGQATDLAALSATLAAERSAGLTNFGEAIAVRNRIGDQQLAAGAAL